MKEATGELNMTVVTVVAIAAVAAFFYAFVWPMVKQNITNSTKCANAVCDATKCNINGNKKICTSCTDASDPSGKKFTCSYTDK